MCGCVCVDFIMCGCVYVWVLLRVGVCMCGFFMCGCFDNCVGVLVICVFVFTVFCIVSFMYILTSVRTTANE
jgi:hypothetical protein